MKISELIESITTAHTSSLVSKGHGFICIFLDQENERLRQNGEYDHPKYDKARLLKELIALLEHEVNYEHVVRHGLPYCMASDDFDKFVEIGNGYIPADVALSTSMKARVGLLVEYGVNKEVPMTGKSD